MLKNKFFLAEDTIIKSLYVLAFSFHTLWFYIITDNRDNLPLVTSMAEHAREIYRHIGMNLSENGAFILSAGILSAVVLNTVRRLSEGLVLGWPRYKGRHNINSLVYAQGRALFYVILTFFALGVTVGDYSKSLNFIDIFFLSFYTFLYGIVINIIDDAVSAVYIFYGGK